MVESEADQLSESVMLGAVMFGHEQMQVVIQAINELVEEGGAARWDWQPPATNDTLVAAVNMHVAQDIADAYKISDKAARYEKINALLEAAVSSLVMKKMTLSHLQMMSKDFS